MVKSLVLQQQQQQQQQQHEEEEGNFVDCEVRQQEGENEEQKLVGWWRRTKEHSRLVLWENLSWDELSGSCGDLGTLIPLLVALARQRAVFLAPALFFAGLSNVLTGYIWDVPMCVQPMKSIAAVALAENLSQEIVTTSGILTGIAVTFLGLTNIIELVNTIIPSPVVCGLQLGVGLKLAGKGITDIVNLSSWLGRNGDGILLATITSLLCMYWLKEDTNKKSKECHNKEQLDDENNNNHTSSNMQKGCWNIRHHPVGIYLFGIGMIFAIIKLSISSSEDGTSFQFFGAPVAVWALKHVTASDWKEGLLQGAIPQLPLTTLNSVISVCALAHTLYPTSKISRREVSLSVGLMNLLFCPFGSMPNCHGAGGLAGQYRFGARHGTCVIYLGLVKIILAITLGASSLILLDAFPTAILGIMLVIAGQELSTTAINTNNSKDRQDTVILLVTAMVILFVGKTHYGAASGWVTYMIYGNGIHDFKTWYNQKQQKHKSIPKKDFHNTVDNNNSVTSSSDEATQDEMKLTP